MARRVAVGWIGVVCASAASVMLTPAAAESVPLATPAGITIQVPTASADSFEDPYRERQVIVQYYADARGMALYTYDQDGKNKSLCYDECARTWPALIAPRNARAAGEWGLTRRRDGRRQWTYQGRPLYTFSGDRVIGEPTGAAPPVDPLEERYGPAFRRTKKDPPDGDQSTAASADPAASAEPPTPWRVAAYELARIATPNGIAVEEVVDANGEVLVADGKTLYAFDGLPGHADTSCSTASCIDLWIPLPAPWLAHPVGDFRLIDRGDGIRQWTYKGKALYTFKHDLAAGDAKGIGVDARWHPAWVKRFYLPPQVRIRESLGLGKVLATADGGMTLYRHTYAVARSLPRDVPVMPEMGRLFGTRSCDAECTKLWKPLEAPADAEPCGFWEILIRGDGKKQWSYKGYALYRYAGEREPGAVEGDTVREIITNNTLDPAPNAAVALASEIKTFNQVILIWSHMYP